MLRALHVRAALLAFSTACPGVAQVLIQDSFLEDAGLGQQDVWDVAAGEDGEVWVAASDGLCRYDGYTWHQYTTRDGLPSNLVRSVCVTSAGEVWAGTDAGAVLFEDERFVPGAAEGRLPGMHVAQIEQGGDGALWFFCDSWNQLDLQGGVVRWQGERWDIWSAAAGRSLSAAQGIEVTGDGAAALIDGALYLLAQDEWRLERYWAGEDGDETPDAWDLCGNGLGALLVRSSAGMHLRRSGSAAWEDLPDPSHVNADLAGMLTAEGVPRIVDNQAEAGLLEYAGGQWVRLGDVHMRSHWPFDTLLPGAGDDLWLSGAGTLLRLRTQDPRWQPSTTQDIPAGAEFSGVDGQGGVWFWLDEGNFRRNARGGLDQQVGRGEVWPAGDGAMWHFREDGTIGLWSYTAEEDSGFWIDIPLPEAGTIVHETALLDSTGSVWSVVARPGGGWSIVTLPSLGASRWQELRPSEEISQEAIILADGNPSGGIVVLHQDRQTGRYGLVVGSSEGLSSLEVPGGWIRGEEPWILSTEDDDLWLYGMRGLWRLNADGGSFRRVEGLPGEMVLDLNYQPGRVVSVARVLSGGRSALTLIGAGEDLQVLGQWDLRLGECIGRGFADQLYFLEAENLLEIPAGEDPVLRPVATPLGMTPKSATRSGDGALRISDGIRELEFVPAARPPKVTLGGERGAVTEGEAYRLRFHAIEHGLPSGAGGPMQYSLRLPGEDWGRWERDLDEAVVLGPFPAGTHAVGVRVMDQSGLMDEAQVKVVVRPVPLRDQRWFVPLAVSLSAIFLALAGWALHSRRRIGHLAGRLQETVVERSAELATSEERYHNLFLQAGDGLVVIDAECRLEDANPAARRLLGLGGEDELGMSLDEFLENERALAEVLRGRDTLMSCDIANRNGELIEVLLSSSSFRERGAQAPRFRISLRDIGDRGHLEQSLAVRQEQLDLALAGSSGATWEVRSQQTSEGRSEHLRVSQRFLLQLGFDADTAPRSVEEWLDLTHPEDRARLPCAPDPEQLDGPLESSSEYRLRIPGQGYRWVRSIARRTHDPAHELTRWFGVHWDVTEERQRQSALEEREERYRRLAENLPGFVFLCDAEPPFRILFVTTQIEKVLGYGVNEVQGEPDFYGRVSHPDDGDQRSAAREAIAGGRSHQFQVRARHANGSWRWFEISLGEAIEGPSGPMVEGYVQDITDRLREDEQRRLMLRELDHRVKNTLATVIAISDRTRAGSQTLDEFEEAFRGRLHTLARVHEALARGGWAGVDVRTLIERCVEPYQGDSSVTLEGGEVELPVDAVTTFSMALNELSTNAAKYGALSVPDGRIHVRWDVVEPEGERTLELSWVETGGPEVRGGAVPGFGTHLIERGIAYEQGGFVDMDLAPEGLRCSLRLPLWERGRRPLVR